MRNINKTLVCVSTCAGLFLWAATSVAQTPKPKRINRAIELLEQGQPIYHKVSATAEIYGGKVAEHGRGEAGRSQPN